MSEFIKDENEKFYIVTLYCNGSGYGYDGNGETSMAGCYTTMDSAKKKFNMLIDEHKPDESESAEEEMDDTSYYCTNFDADTYCAIKIFECGVEN